jgi:hypothetical protein
MILLTFTTAAKYIISLLLAVLGIIPFEEVKSFSHEATEQVQATRNAEQQPLEPMANLTFRGDLFSGPGRKTLPGNDLIPLRNEHSIETGSLSGCLPATVECAQASVFSVEIEKELEKIQKVIIFHKDEVKALSPENIYFFASGI